MSNIKPRTMKKWKAAAPKNKVARVRIFREGTVRTISVPKK